MGATTSVQIEGGKWKTSKNTSSRRHLYNKCGSKCFLLPSELKYPICNSQCHINKEGVHAAYVRAREWKNDAVAKKALHLLNGGSLPPPIYNLSEEEVLTQYDEDTPPQPSTGDTVRHEPYFPPNSSDEETELQRIVREELNAVIAEAIDDEEVYSPTNEMGMLAQSVGYPSETELETELETEVETELDENREHIEKQAAAELAAYRAKHPLPTAVDTDTE